MGCDNIYLWRDPVVTGPIFVTMLTVMISICYYSLISVAAYTALFILGTAAGVKLYVYVMKTFLKKDNVNDPIQRCAGFDPSIPDEKITDFAKNASGKLNCAIGELRRLFLIDNMVESVKFGLALWFLTYVGSCFNAMTLVILAWVGLFTVPKIYLNNQKTLDPILQKVKVQLDEIKSKVGAFIPSGKAAATEVKKEE
jgi:hypothetical protein